MQKFIKINNHKVFYYQDDAMEHKKTVVLFHGLRSNMQAFNKLIKLSRNYNIVAFDFISHGLTENVENTTLELITSVANDLLLKLNITNYDAIGISLGGWIIANIKNKPSKAVLISPYNPFVFDHTSINKLKLFIDPTNEAEALNSVKSLVSSSFDNATYWKNINETAKAMFQNVEKMHPYLDTLINKQILSNALSQKGKKAFETLKNIPTLLIFGTDDKFIPEQSIDDLAKLINSKVIKLKNVGHAPLFEDQQKTIQIINNFISK